MTAQDFVQHALPHSWFLVADNLFEESRALYSRAQRGSTRQLNAGGGVLGDWPNSNRSTFLLAGFALENAIKAFLVYENPQWISNGVLARSLKSHRLVELSKKSALIPWPKRGITVLSQFERGLDSWARYPCALSAAVTEREQNLTPELWGQYLQLMRAYGKALMDLLSREWTGPHGFAGRYEFRGSYLGAQAKSSKSALRRVA
jgi:hypothetical protein